MQKLNQIVSVDTLKIYLHPDDVMFIEDKFPREDLPLKVVRGFHEQLLFRDSRGKSVWGVSAYRTIGGMSRKEDWSFNPPSGSISINVRRQLCRGTFGTVVSLSFSVPNIHYEFDNYGLVDQQGTATTFNYVKGVVGLLGIRLDIMKAVVSRADLFCHIETKEAVKNYLPLFAAFPAKRRTRYETSILLCNKDVALTVYDKARDMGYLFQASVKE